MILKEKLDSLGYDYEELDDQIFLIKNFVKPEELDACYQFCISKSQEDWKRRYLDTIIEDALQKFNRDDIWELEAEGLISINPDWIDKTIDLGEAGQYPWIFAQRIKEFVSDDVEPTPLVGVQRHYTGTSLKEHIDSETSEDLVLAAVVYFNDDYVDGELYFPTRGIELRPPKGSLMLFSTGKEYLHGVKTVGEGPDRLVTAGFVWRKGARA